MNLFRELKKPLILITYAAVLVAVILNLNYFGGALGLVLRVSASIAYGIGIAFVLNLLLKLYEDKLLCRLWKRFPKLGRRRRVITVLLTVITTLLILFLLVLFVFPQLTESLMSLMNKIPGYTEELNRMFTDISTRYTFIANFINNTQVNVNEILNASGQFLSVALPTIADFTFGLTNSIVNTFVGFIFAIYFLYYKEKLIGMIKNMLLAFTPAKVSNFVVSFCKEANSAFSRFIGGQLTEALILGILCFIGMSILRFPYALLISTIIAVTALIPILGAWIGTIPSALLIFMENPLQALWFVIFILVLQQLESNLIYPRVVGKSIGMSGLWVMVAITIGGGMFGLFGMLVSVPLLSVLYTFLRRFTYRRLERKKLSPEPDGPPAK